MLYTIQTAGIIEVQFLTEPKGVGRLTESTNYMAMNLSAGGGEPMCDVTRTPLIDVMLVLLVMLILTLPVQNHAVKSRCAASTMRRRKIRSASTSRSTRMCTVVINGTAMSGIPEWSSSSWASPRSCRSRNPHATVGPGVI